MGKVATIIYDVNEIAERLKVTSNVIRKLLREGRLKGFKVGGKMNDWKILSSDFKEFLTKGYGENLKYSFWDGRLKRNRKKK